MVYKEWLSEWLTYYVKPSVKEKTYLNYSEAVRNYVLPRLGDRPMEELNRGLLQRFATALFEQGNVRTGEGLSPLTVSQAISLVQRSLKAAVDAGLIQTHYANSIAKPRTNDRRSSVNCFTKREQNRIEDYIARRRDPKLYGILVVLYTGLRIGELVALSWEDIDFENGLLTVCKTCRDGWGGGCRKVFGSPKTPSSHRLIPIPRQIVPYLKRMKRYGDGTFVMSKKNGKMISIRSYQRTFARVLERANVPHRGFHALRHTFATRALENEMDIKTLAEVMGHKSPAITLAIYVHSLAPHKKQMMNRLGRLLGHRFDDDEED